MIGDASGVESVGFERQALLVAATHGLAGTLVEPPRAPLSPSEWEQLLDLATTQRLTGMLARTVLSGVLPATEEQADQLRGVETTILCNALALEAILVRVANQLDAEKIPFRVLKGPAVARLDYPDPALRDFCDIDLLIRPEDLDRTVELLTYHGCSRHFPEPRPGFDRRFTKSVPVHTPDGGNIDLHRTLAPGPYGLRIDLDALWERPTTPFVLGGRLFEALGPDDRFLHACYHAALGDVPARLVPQRDVAQMLLFGSVDGARVRRLAAAWRGEAVVAHAVAGAWSMLQIADVVALSAWADRFRPAGSDRRELAEATSPAKSYGAQALASVRAIPGSRNRVAYVSALAFPRRSYLDGRHDGFVDRIKHMRQVRNEMRRRSQLHDASLPHPRTAAAGSHPDVAGADRERTTP